MSGYIIIYSVKLTCLCPAGWHLFPGHLSWGRGPESELRMVAFPLLFSEAIHGMNWSCHIHKGFCSCVHLSVLLFSFLVFNYKLIITSCYLLLSVFMLILGKICFTGLQHAGRGRSRTCRITLYYVGNPQCPLLSKGEITWLVAIYALNLYTITDIIWITPFFFG